MTNSNRYLGRHLFEVEESFNYNHHIPKNYVPKDGKLYIEVSEADIRARKKFTVIEWEVVAIVETWVKYFEETGSKNTELQEFLKNEMYVPTEDQYVLKNVETGKLGEADESDFTDFFENRENAEMEATYRQEEWIRQYMQTVNI